MSSLELVRTVMRLTIVFLLLMANVAFADIASVNNRGLIALPASGGGVYLSWRLFDSDPADVAFNIYRIEAGQTVKLNSSPLQTTTDFVDAKGRLDADVVYRVEVAGSGKRSAPALKPRLPTEPFLQFATGSTTFGRNLAVGDLLGRGQVDFVLRHSGVTVDPYYAIWRPSQSTYHLTAFDQSGTRLWQYNMGWAIEQGMWYSPFLVYDLDGDGRAELVVKGGDETMGKTAMRDRTGRVLYGPEYVRVIDGRDGNTVLAQADWPSRGGFDGADPANTPLLERKYEDYNRYSRNFLAVAYLDGVKPYLIVSRGTYDKHKVVAYDYQPGKLTEVWRWENVKPSAGGNINHWGQGAHTLFANDVDGDGRDEIVLGALVLDDDGSVLYSLGHGHTEHVDHVYVGDIDPSRPGKELYYGAEWGHDSKGIGLHDAATGKRIWAIDWPTTHIHDQGLCADLDADSPGLECYSGEENRTAQWLLSSTGKVLSEESLPGLSPNAAWWDADVQKELVEKGNGVDDDIIFALSNYPARDRRYQLPYPEDVPQSDREHLRVIAVMDLLGDWREEVIVADRTRLLVYATTIPADRRLPWLMSDHSYQMGVVTGSVGYYQQPLLDMSLAKRTIPTQTQLPYGNGNNGAARPAESVSSNRDDDAGGQAPASGGQTDAGISSGDSDQHAPPEDSEPSSQPGNPFLPVGEQPATPVEPESTPAPAPSEPAEEPQPAAATDPDDGASVPPVVEATPDDSAPSGRTSRKRSRLGAVDGWQLGLLILLLAGGWRRSARGLRRAPGRPL